MTSDLADRYDVVVVGAGLAGLAAARVVQDAGRSVALLEAADAPGGRVRSDHVSGFTLDRGFQVLLTAYPEVTRQLDGAALDLREFDPGARVWTGRRMCTLGDPVRRPGQLWSSAVAPVGSVVDKARVALLLHRLRRAQPTRLLRGHDISTAAALAELGFSPRLIQRFLRPLLGGIQLDLELSGSRRMSDMVLRTLAVGASAVPANGMQAIPDQLAARLAPGVLRLETPVVAVEPGVVRLADGRQVTAGRVVVATEGPAAAHLLHGQAGTQAVLDRGSRAAACVWFSAPRSPAPGRSIILDGTGQGPVANVTVMSDIAPTYAPPGRALVAAACPGTTGAHDLGEAARAQLRGWWGDEVAHWEVLRVDRIAHAQPDSRPPFHPKQGVALGQGLFVCGDHRDTPSIQGALFSGRRCGEAVVIG